jgi:hypothetical protein
MNPEHKGSITAQGGIVRGVSRVVFLGLVFLVLVGCKSVSSDVVDSVQVLRDNTLSLSAEYSGLLDRAGPPALPEGPEEETEAELTERKDAWQTKWDKHVSHEKTLMSANNRLAEKVLEWAQVNQEE